jgi:SM-20-related protein
VSSEILLVPNFLEPALLERVVAAVCSADGNASLVYGGKSQSEVDLRVRSVRNLAVTDEVRNLVTGLLAAAQSRVGAHFGVALGGFEPPQFLRYQEGDFFVAHQDGNTPVVRDQTLDRRVSVVIFLNAPSEEPGHGGYGGGALTLHGAYPHFDERTVVPAAAGTLAAFRSETTHEVTPVTHGFRYTVVSWYRATGSTPV